MTANFAISLVGRPAQVGRPPSCALAVLSATARPCRTRQIRASLHLNRDPSGESRLKGALFSIGIYFALCLRRLLLLRKRMKRLLG